MHDQPYESLDSVIELVDLSKISDPRGNLTFIEGNRHVPFDIKRVYYLYDVPGGEMRAGHAHHQLQQLIIGISGASISSWTTATSVARSHATAPSAAC